MIFLKLIKLIIVSIVFASILVLSGCASLSRQEEEFRISSKPSGADVTIKHNNNFVQKGKTPFTYKNPGYFSWGRPSYTFDFEKEGYCSGSTRVEARVSDAIVYNIFNYGIGLIVDYFTGAWWQYKYTSTQVELSPTPEMIRVTQQQRDEEERKKVEEERQRAEAKSNWLKQRQMKAMELMNSRPLENILKIASEVKGTLVFKGFYLEMPIDDTTVLFNHYLGFSTNSWFEHDSNTIYQCVIKSDEITKSKPLATFNDKSALMQIILRNDQIKELFNVHEIHLERFMIQFAKLFKTPPPQHGKTEVVDRSQPALNAYGSATIRTYVITDEKTYVVRLVEDEHDGYFAGVRGGGKDYTLTIERPKWLME